jgi:hypothetical protein
MQPLVVARTPCIDPAAHWLDASPVLGGCMEVAQQKKELTVCVRLYKDGAATRVLRHMRVGDEVDIAGPFDGEQQSFTVSTNNCISHCVRGPSLQCALSCFVGCDVV